jgi:hypothetical protein
MVSKHGQDQPIASRDTVHVDVACWNKEKNYPKIRTVNFALANQIRWVSNS